MRIGILSAELGHEDVQENKRLVREIRLKGHKPKIINYRRTVIVIANKKRLLYQPDDKGFLHPVSVDAVIPRINEADEQSINLASLALETLISNGAYSTATPSSIRQAKNKIRSLTEIGKAGVPVPRSAGLTGTASYEIDIDRVLKAVEPNLSKQVIVKTNTGTHGKGVMLANSRGEARAIVEGFLANNIPVLVQQFIPPGKKDSYTDLRFILVNGQVVGAMKRVSTKKDEFRANISLGGKGSAYTPSTSEIEMAKNATKALGLSVAGVDMIPSGRSRLIIEVNTSPGFVVEEVLNINLAKKIVQLAISGAKRGERNSAQKISDLLNSEVIMPHIKPLPSPKFRTINKIKLPKLGRKKSD